MFKPVTTTQEIFAATNQELINNTVNHQCSGCGECCTNTVALVQSDISRIKRYIKRHNIKPEDNAKKYALLGLRDAPTIDLTCPFLRIETPGTNGTKQKAVCTIYPVRPAVCQGFTCEIASDKDKMQDIYQTLSKILTPQEMQEFVKTKPVSMRDTFFK